MPKDIPIIAAVEEVRRRARTKGLILEHEPAKAESKSKIAGASQLTLWSEKVRGLPNPVARSALFTASNRPRLTFKNHPIATSSGIDIFYTGEELRQQDEDVFLQIVHLARMRPLGDVIEVSGYQLLKALGWSFDSRAYKRLRESIERLTSGAVKIQFTNGARAGYMGTMIQKVIWDGGAGTSEGRLKWWIFLDSEIINLFGSDGYSLIDWEQRLNLRDLAKWLHSFYYTHAEPFPYKVETIYTMCGSHAKTMSHFRADLKVSLRDLEECSFLTSWEITKEDLVVVKRNRKQLKLNESLGIVS